MSGCLHLGRGNGACCPHGCQVNDNIHPMWSHCSSSLVPQQQQGHTCVAPGQDLAMCLSKTTTTVLQGSPALPWRDLLVQELLPITQYGYTQWENNSARQGGCLLHAPKSSRYFLGLHKTKQV